MMLAILVGGCDTLDTVSRSNTYNMPLDLACIETTLRKTEGVTKVTRKDRKEESFGILPHFGSVETENKAIYYEAESVNAVVQVVSDSTNPQIIVKHHTRLNEKIPKSYMQKLIPVMDKVEAKLMQECKVSFFNEGKK